VEPPKSAGPFFCPHCQAIIDPSGALKAPVPQARHAETGPPAPHSEYVSRYASSAPREVAGPGTSFNVGGSAILGYFLAAVAGVVVGGGLAWVGAHHLRIPLVYPLIAGWAIRRGLAAGAGGGTPDRGPIGLLVLLAICVGTFVGGEFVAYRGEAARENSRFRNVYGTFPVTDPVQAIRDLKNVRDADGNGEFALPDGTKVVIDDEDKRLNNFLITHEYADEPYDVKLLGDVGKKGFVGHLYDRLDQGEDLRITADKVTWHIPGFGVVVLAILEFLILAMSAFARIQ
jgi:hypothetical protein